MHLSFFIVATEASPCLTEVIDSIDMAINNYPTQYTYEVLVCSFDEIKFDNPHVIWIEDKLKQPGNTVQALNGMVEPSSGEYIFLLNDDHKFPNSNPLQAVEYLQSDAFKDRKYKVTGIGAGPNTNSDANRQGATCIPNLNLWQTTPSRFPDHDAFPEELKNPRFCGLPHRYLVWGFPVFERKSLMEHFGGHVLNPSFKHHFADNFLPFWYAESSGDYPLYCEDSAFAWCPREGSTTTVNNDLYDYKVFCALCVKFLREGSIPYDTKVEIE